jgi:hypothetical protein
VDFIGISLLMVVGTCGFVMHKYSEYKKNERYRVQVLNYEMKRFVDQTIHDFNKNKG